MVPCSSKVAKYRGIIQKKKERHSQRIQMLETFILTQQPQEDSTKNDVERNVAAEYGMGQQL